MEKMNVLISTMNLKNKKEHDNLLKKMNVIDNSITINQVTDNSQELLFNDSTNKLLSFYEKGLSKSRNHAILNSNCDICIIGDDDLRYVKNYEKIIKEAYKKYPDADIIAFDVERNSKVRKIHSLKEGKVNSLQTLKIRSVQITFKRKSIVENNILFDERFGSGSGKYDSGEESIFLTDCMNKKLKIYYCKQKIGEVSDNNSSWYKGLDELFLVSKGAMFYRISKIFSLPLILQFAIRKYKLYKENYSFIKCLKLMLKGKEELKKILNDENKIKIFMVGDFKSNTGPANVNKNLKLYLPSNTLYSMASNQIIRVFELIIKLLLCDAICFCSFSKLNVFGIKLSKFLGKNTFYLMHGYVKFEQEIHDIINESKVKSERYILDNVERVFCVSSMFCDYMKQFDFKTKFDYVYNGINWDNITSKKGVQNKFQIMSIGGGKSIKNNLVVCEAINKINKNLDEKIKYIVVGDSCGKKNEFLKYDFVEYYDKLSHEECLSKMAESNLYIQNSKFETFGLAIIEALANGCSLLVSNKIGALGILETMECDVISNEDDVLEIASKIQYILKNNNNERIMKSIDKEKTSINIRAKELVNKIKTEVLSSYKGD